MTKPLPPITKSKPVMISTAASVLTIGYKILDAVGNADFALQKLGFSEGAAKFLGSPRTIDVMIAASLLALVFSLVYQVNRVIETAAVAQTDKGAATVSAPAQDEKPPARIVAANITPEYLTGFFKDHTDAQAQRLLEPYLGKWITVTSHISNVYSDDQSVNVFMYENDNQTSAVFRDPLSMASASILRRNDLVTIFGKIEQVTHNGVRLEECQIVEARPPEKVPEEWKSD